MVLPSPKSRLTSRASPSSFSSISPPYLIGSLLLCLAIAGMVWWFLSNFERVTRTDYSLKTQAQYNPYYAAELLLNAEYNDKSSRLGQLDEQPDESWASTLLDSDLKSLIDNLPTLNSEDADNEGQPTLIINSIGSKLSEERFAALQSWVEQGGHLITYNSTQADAEDMAEVSKRLSELGEQHATPEQIQADEALKELIAKLDTANQFLARLGIFAVRPMNNKASGDVEDMEAQLQALLDEMQMDQSSSTPSQDTDASASQKTSRNLKQEALKDSIKSLAKSQPLSIAAIPENPFDKTSPVSVLMIKSPHRGGHLNAELFTSFYPKTAKVHYHSALAAAGLTLAPKDDSVKEAGSNLASDANDSAQDEAAERTQNVDDANQESGAAVDDDISDNPATQKLYAQYIDQQAPIVRQYLSQQQAALTQQLVSQPPAATVTTKQTKQQKQVREANELVAAMLAMNDEQLVGLFKPIDDVYLDARLGKGRLSVIMNDESFTNPNPAIDLKDDETDLLDLMVGEADPDNAEVKGNEVNDIKESTGANTQSEIEAVSTLQALIGPQYRTTLLTADNAAWLTALTAQSSEVWILPNTDVDPLPIMLWKQARPAILGLGLLAIIWLWSLYNSFGKRAFLPDNQSHDILRYFRQVGRFGWQQDYAIKLTRQTRDQIRALVSERLSSQGKLVKSDEQSSVTDNQTTDALAAENLTASSLTSNVETQASELHQLLLAQIEHKKRQAQSSTQSNNRHASSHQVSSASSAHAELIPSQLSDAAATSRLLIDNEDFIRASITTERLKVALAPTRQDTDNALTFTQMTQTLWVIDWLLK
ncbi:MAG: hypothetical protein Q4P13_07485 [Psychrobacter sp.]|nr:hypothetical protein [Psychrobacter sp.]